MRKLFLNIQDGDPKTVNYTVLVGTVVLMTVFQLIGVIHIY